MKSMPHSLGRASLLALLIQLNISVGAWAQSAKSIRVLFVGNSLTFYNNLPQSVAAMAATRGVSISARQSTVSGSSLEEHWKSEKGTITRKLLDEQSWDYVIFNNHSSSAIDSRESFMEYGKKFIELVRSKHAKPVLMMTWAYKSNPLMQKQITAAYEELASKTGTDCIPAGLVFQKVREARPDMELFSDDKHPSPLGTYLVGLTFFKYFTGASPVGMTNRVATTDKDGENLYLLMLNPEDADFLQQAVEEFEGVVKTK
jgi:hypothetical protein